MATTNPRHRLGVHFLVALATSWILSTAGVALAIWTGHAGSPVRIATWVSLWTFSVLAPTVSAMTIHRALARISDAAPHHQAALDELAGLRPYLLLSATMALISAFALILGH
jgi:hypothetical protein